MKLGIIIIFHNNAEDVNKAAIVSILNEMNNVQFCFVNNASRDKTLDMLRQIKEDCPRVSIVDIKKYASELLAIKAGARFLNSSLELHSLGYVNVENFKNEKFKLTALLSDVQRNIEYFQDTEQLLKRNGNTKKPILKISFSVIDYLNYLDSNLGLVS